jgi:hypothetical protein
MSALGPSRHFGRRPTTSGLPLETDIVRTGRHVSKVPTSGYRRLTRSLVEQSTILADEDVPCGKGRDTSQMMDQVSASLTCLSKKRVSWRLRCQGEMHTDHKKSV